MRISFKSGRIWDTALSIVLVLAILGAVVALFYTVANPKTKEKFTEFYILGLEGGAVNYPKGLGIGEGERVIVGIINREQETVSYLVQVRIDGVKNNEVGVGVLEHDEKWEGKISFMSMVAGDNQKVEFLLYKAGQSEAYLSLHLWVDVIE